MLVELPHFPRAPAEVQWKLRQPSQANRSEFTGARRVTITGVRVKTDQCAGQSFIRSYATLTSSTENTDDIITYLGVTKAV